MSEKNKYILIGVAVVVLVIIATVWINKSGQTPVANETGDVQGTETESNAKTFSGTVSAVDMGCTYDMDCSVTIDGKKIILARGGLAPTVPVGKLIGVNSIGDIKGKIGAFANVYAGLTPEGDYTLYGNADYYVEITTISGK
ncbi:MAG: hypothetical protein V4699_00630 [Patescibacteria group bacterium]